MEGVSMRRDRQEIEQRLRGLRQEFCGIAGATVSNEWRDVIQNPTTCLIETARMADLIVMALSGTASFDKADRSVNLGDLAGLRHDPFAAQRRRHQSSHIQLRGINFLDDRVLKRSSNIANCLFDKVRGYSAAF